MREHVTVVPTDRLIRVDGIPLRFDFAAPGSLRALHGHMEWTDDLNHPLTSVDYAQDVAPFVELWEAEKARLEAEAQRPPTLEEAKAAKLAEINAVADKAIATLTATYPDREIATFDKQEAEARAYAADPTAATPLLSALSQARGMELPELVRRVIAKADAFAVVCGSIIGQRQALEDRLDACETLEDVEALTVAITMPGEEAEA